MARSPYRGIGSSGSVRRAYWLTRGGRSDSGSMRFRVITKVAPSPARLCPAGRAGFVGRRSLVESMSAARATHQVFSSPSVVGRTERVTKTSAERVYPLRAHFMSCWCVVLAYRPSGDGHTSP